MISLGSFILFCLIVTAFAVMLWRLRSTLAGVLLATGIALLGVFVCSLVYWVHFYLGDSSWPFYLTWATLGASFLVLIGSAFVKIRAPKVKN